MPQPAPIRLPLQYTPWRKEQFQSDSGISALNQWQLQVINTLNAASGNNGPAVIPGGVDVQGASITGLAAPTGPTDAVSAGHAGANYGAPAVGPDLDIGGKNTLKGLAYTYQASTQNSQAIADISGALPVNYDGSANYINLFGLILQWGKVTTDIGAGTLPVAFPTTFPTAALSVVVSASSSTDRIVYVVDGSVTPSGFTIGANGSGSFAYWIATGY